MNNEQSERHPEEKGKPITSKSAVFDYREAFRLNYGIFSDEQQERVRRARVLIVGVGGAGGVVAIELARSGVGCFTLVDPDIYTESNLNRQIACFSDTLSNFKAEAVKDEILRINPEASVKAVAAKLPFEDIAILLDECDVYVAAADDLAFSTTTILMAEKKKKMVVSQVPSGMAGYIMVFPPDLKRAEDPIDLFGGPRELSYEELYKYIASPLNKFGRRWYITQGKWRIEWFNKWRQNELQMQPLSKWCFKYNFWNGDSLACEGMNKRPLVPLTQLCPAVWLGASLASIEVLKYLTGKGKLVRAPRMWHYQLADNSIRVERFRRRSWFFFKLIDKIFKIKCMGIGEHIRLTTMQQLETELSAMEKQEQSGNEVKVPFLWKHLI